MVNAKLALAALISLAYAAPAPAPQGPDESSTDDSGTQVVHNVRRSSSSSSSFIITNLSYSLASPLTRKQYEDAPRLPLVPLSPADQYKGLHYEGFLYVDAGIDGALLTGVKPSSPSTIIASSAVSDLVAGGASRIDTDGTTTTSFDFESFRFGCSVNPIAVSVVGVPQACTVSVTGYDADGESVANQQFSFVPTGLKSDMAYAELNDDFYELSAVEFTSTSELKPVVAALFDDLTFTLYQ